MNDDERVRSLLAAMLDSGLPAEQVCAEHPDLLPIVSGRWQRMQSISKDLDALFPSGGRAQRASPLTDAPRLPGYEQIEFVGRGGMGVVYRALHTALHRVVAVKMLLPGMHDAPHETEALLREASAVAAIQHPNIVQVFDVAAIDARPYFTMEFLEGGSLAQRMGGAPQPPRQAAELTALLATAVQVAHERGVVHRDLKPGNILFTLDGSPKIADFGLARLMACDPSATLGQAGFGTPSYMAPEQALGAPGRNEPAVDVYALGAILYDLLTGRPPFRADSPLETQRQVIEQEPAPPSRLNARVPRDLETVCLACLSKDPARRYASAGALADDLRRFLRGEPIAARPIGPAERLRKWVRRHPTRTAAWLGAILCLTMIFSAVLWTASQRAAFERAVATDFTEIVRLQRAGDWSGARNMLERAKTRIGLGYGSDESARRAAEIARELDFVDRLAAMRLERASSREIAFDRRKWWNTYRDEFRKAGLLVEGDDPGAFAARVASSNARVALIDAMDDWAICAADKGEVQWLLIATRTADPDPAWRDRARSVMTWQDQNQLEALAREARLEDQPVPLMLIVAGLLMEQRSEEGLPFLRRIQAAHPSDFWACFALAESLAPTDPDVISFYRAAVALRPQAAAAHVNLGNALSTQNRVPEAIECMQRALSLDAHNHVAQFNIAIWLLQEERYDECAAHARQATSLNPSDPLGHGVLGSALLQIGQPAEAAESFRRAISLLPEGHPRRASFERALERCAAMLAPPAPARAP
ncbi:MAG: protein kinase [Planctomycetota bacterium]|nr:protein kinase [Planctomycetota bacterium]